MKTYCPRPTLLVLPALVGLQLSVFTLGTTSAAAAPEPVVSALSAATVYSDRAVVTRTADLDLTAGAHELTFENLPSALMDDSLQVAAKGSAKATILDVNARNTFVEATPDPKVKDLEDQLKALAAKQRALEDRAAVLNQQRDYLLRIQTASTTPVTGAKDANPTDVDSWVKMLAFTAKGLSDVTLQQQELEYGKDGRQDLRDQQTALQDQLNQLRNGGISPFASNSNAIIRPNPNRSRNVKTVTVRVSVATAGKLQVALSYGVRGASWSPSYDARLHADAAQPSVDLAYSGNIRQNTGEDWPDVRLTLSTARPSLGGGAPELNAWVLDARPAPRPIRALVSNRAAAGRGGRGGGGGGSGGAGGPGLVPAALAANKDGTQAFDGPTDALTMSLADTNGEAAYVSASVDTGVTSASYQIPGTTTILSDNAPQKVRIGSPNLKAELQYESTPRQLAAAFLSAHVTNSSDLPLLAGPMNTFLDDDFIAASSLKTVMPNEKFELNLGADEGIAVKRKLNNRLTSETGFTSKYTHVAYDFTITATNNKKTEALFVFKELLPVSRNDKIRVELDTPAKREVGTPDKPGNEVTLEEDGKLVWRVKLKPGEKRDFPLKFWIEYPADLAVSGLE